MLLKATWNCKLDKDSMAHFLMLWLVLLLGLVAWVAFLQEYARDPCCVSFPGVLVECLCWDTHGGGLNTHTNTDCLLRYSTHCTLCGQCLHLFLISLCFLILYSIQFLTPVIRISTRFPWFITEIYSWTPDRNLKYHMVPYIMHVMFLGLHNLLWTSTQTLAYLEKYVLKMKRYKQTQIVCTRKYWNTAI